MRKWIAALMLVLAFAGTAEAKKKSKEAKAQPVAASVAVTPAVTPEDTWVIQLSNGGVIRIQLRPDKAPTHIARIKGLTRAHFYDGLAFHRVIEGFMAQGGDPRGTGQGGSPLADLKAEFNDLPHLRGTVSMARADSKDSANSQFFICFMPVMKLDNNYTAFGRVIAGMNVVDTIERGEPPANPTKIIHAWIDADGPNMPAQPLPVN